MSATRRNASLILAAACLLFFTRLGGLDLWAPDEPRYAQVAEELRSREHGFESLVVLRLNGDVYTQKPPLYFWLAAVAGSLSGRVTEWAIRVPSALAGLATVALTLWMGRLLFPRSPAAALWGGAILMTVARFGHMARRGQLDVLLAMWELAALAIYAYVQFRPTHAQPSPALGVRPTRGELAAIHGALGMAVLTKGPVGLLPLAIIAAHLAWSGRARSLRSFCPPWAFLLSVAPGVLWISVATVLTPSGFADEAIVDNLIGRFFAGSAHDRPWYYFAYQLPLDFLPWTLVWPFIVPAVIRNARNQPSGRSSQAQARSVDAWRFLICLVAVPFFFFSLSAGKRGLYMLPSFPGLALMTGAALAEAARNRGTPASWMIKTHHVAVATVLALGIWIGTTKDLSLPGNPGFEVPAAFGFSLAAAAALSWLAGIFVGRTRTLLAMLAAIELASFLILYPAFDDEKSPRPIADAAAEVAGPGSPIGIYQYTALVGGIAYYSDNPVVSLYDPQAVLAYVAQGGRALVTSPRHVESLSEVVTVKVVRPVRSGSRERWVIELAPPVEALPDPIPPGP